MYVQLGPIKASGNNNNLPLPSITLAPSSADGVYGRFGWALAALDFNADGIQDLAVASPTYGWNWTETAVSPDFMCGCLPIRCVALVMLLGVLYPVRLCSYRGRVEVFFGSKVPASSNPFAAKPDVVINAETVRVVRLDTVLFALIGFCCVLPQLLTNFGSVLSVGDVNGDGLGDLIVGNPIARGDPAAGASIL